MRALEMLFGGLTAAYWLYALASLAAAKKWSQSRVPEQSGFQPAVTILKPVSGVDAEAYENFASFCRLDYPKDRYQILFGALDPNDPALELVHRLIDEFPDCDITLADCGGPLHGHNRKVSNLLAMEPLAKHEMYVLCDSDMRVEPDYLNRVIAPFAPKPTGEPSKVGLVTCPYRGCRPKSFAAILEALGIGADFIPSALVSRMIEGVGFAFGSTIALPRKVLAEIGGFEGLADQLADDFRLGERTRKAGYEVVISDYVVDDLLGDERFSAMWSRRLRWAKTARSCRPGGYAGSLVTHGLVLSALLVLSSGFAAWAIAVLFATLALRLAVASWIASRYTRDANVLRYLLMMPIGDLISFALFASSFFGSEIRWRGVRFRLMRGGDLVPLAPLPHGTAHSVSETGRSL